MQEILDVKLTEIPVTLSKYKSFNLNNLPKVILGFQIRNQFDEKRLHFKSGFKAKRILHYTQSVNKKELELEPIFFYGIELDIKEEYKDFFKNINNLIFKNVFSKNEKIDIVKQYQEYLQTRMLDCNETFLHLCDGVYPLDLKYLEKIISSPKNILIHNLPEMLKITKEQWYLNIGAFGIYVLISSNFYSL